jgi:hypothetical protein
MKQIKNEVSKGNSSRGKSKIILKYYIRKFKFWWSDTKHKVFLILSVIMLLLMLSYLAFHNKVKIVDNSINTVVYMDTVNTLDNFLYKMAYIESSNNHRARRSYIVVDISDKGVDSILVYSQYIGLFQMGYSARQSIGLHKISEEEYLDSPELQKKSMILWLKYLKKELKPEIEKYDGKFVELYYITESGLLAMAHLCGAEGVRQFLRSNGRYIPSDGNGKRGTDYLQQYGRYNLELEKSEY